MTSERSNSSLSPNQIMLFRPLALAMIVAVMAVVETALTVVDTNLPITLREEAFQATVARRSLEERNFASRRVLPRLAVQGGDIEAVSALEDPEEGWETVRYADVWLTPRTLCVDVRYKLHVRQIMPGGLNLPDYGGKYILLQKICGHSMPRCLLNMNDPRECFLRFEQVLWCS